MGNQFTKTIMLVYITFNTCNNLDFVIKCVRDGKYSPNEIANNVNILYSRENVLHVLIRYRVTTI